MERHRFVVVVAAVVLAGCTAGSAQSGSATPTPEPPKPGITLVRANQPNACKSTVLSDDKVGPNEVIVEHFRCTGGVWSDPRLDGTLEMDLTTTFAPAGGPIASWKGTLTITNAGGTWTGTGRGAVVVWPDQGGAPTNYGEDIYAGTGAYTGLTYHELIAGGDVTAMTSGWIVEKP